MFYISLTMIPLVSSFHSPQTPYIQAQLGPKHTDMNCFPSHLTSNFFWSLSPYHPAKTNNIFMNVPTNGFLFKFYTLNT